MNLPALIQAARFITMNAALGVVQVVASIFDDEDEITQRYTRLPLSSRNLTEGEVLQALRESEWEILSNSPWSKAVEK